MNYFETFKPLAEKSIRPLADQWAKLLRQRAAIQKRAAAEEKERIKAEEEVARWKGLAGEYLADSPGAFNRYRTGLKRALARLETSKETVRLFASDLLPAKERELEAARLALAAACAVFYAASRPACEAEMARMLDAVVAERDAFMAAFSQLGKDYGTSFSRDAPKVSHVRLDSVKRHILGLPWLEFTPAPAAAPAPATMPAVPVQATATPVGNPPAAAPAPDGPQDVQEGAGTHATAAPASEDGQGRPKRRYVLTGETTPAPVRVHDAPGNPTAAAPEPAEGEPSAQEGPSAAPEAAPEAISDARTPALDTEATSEEALDGDDLDALDCAAVDAEDEADLDAEAPPAPPPALDQSVEPGAAAPETQSACPVADALDAEAPRDAGEENPTSQRNPAESDTDADAAPGPIA